MADYLLSQNTRCLQLSDQFDTCCVALSEADLALESASSLFRRSNSSLSIPSSSLAWLLWASTSRHSCWLLFSQLTHSPFQLYQLLVFVSTYFLFVYANGVHASRCTCSGRSAAHLSLRWTWFQMTHTTNYKHTRAYYDTTVAMTCINCDTALATMVNIYRWDLATVCVITS